MERAEELAEKQARVARFLEEQDLDGVLLTRTDNFAWITGGGENYIVGASEVGFISLLITRSARYVVTTTIEMPRALDEELQGLGYEPLVYEWYRPERFSEVVGRIVPPARLASDVPFPGARSLGAEWQALQYQLTPAEIARYRALGQDVGAAVAATVREIVPGWSEHQIAAALAGRLLPQGIRPDVLLVATDERIYRYRHPIPVDRRVQRYAMLVTGAKRHGLIVAITRMVHFGPLPAELERKWEAVSRVHAAAMAASRPGTPFSAVLRRMVDAYREVGYADEWTLHHQGGPIGYRGRDFLATFDTHQPVLLNQAVAWNPSITGTKSEDTFIVGEWGAEVLTRADWPTRQVQLDGATWEMPDVLVR